jgi:hypothetical protein
MAAYGGFKPLIPGGGGGGGVAPKPAPAARAAPGPSGGGGRRSDWHGESALGGAGESAGGEHHSAEPALRSTFLDKEEAAMRRAMAKLNGDDPSRAAGDKFSASNRARISAGLAHKAKMGLVPHAPNPNPNPDPRPLHDLNLHRVSPESPLDLSSTSPPPPRDSPSYGRCWRRRPRSRATTELNQADGRAACRAAWAAAEAAEAPLRQDRPRPRSCGGSSARRSLSGRWV